MQFQILPDPLAGADVVPVTPQRLKAKVCVPSSLPPPLLLAPPPLPRTNNFGLKDKAAVAEMPEMAQMENGKW